MSLTRIDPSSYQIPTITWSGQTYVVPKGEVNSIPLNIYVNRELTKIGQQLRQIQSKDADSKTINTQITFNASLTTLEELYHTKNQKISWFKKIVEYMWGYQKQETHILNKLSLLKDQTQYVHFNKNRTSYYPDMNQLKNVAATLASKEKMLESQKETQSSSNTPTPSSSTGFLGGVIQTCTNCVTSLLRNFV